MKRLFLAIAPPPQQLAQLAQLQDKLDGQGRRVPSANLHLTLYFLGQTQTQQQAALMAALERLADDGQLSAFGVTLDTLAYWQRPRILCLKGQAHDPRLLALYRHCRRLSQRLGLHDATQAFNPHITLMRKAAALPSVPCSPLTLTGRQLHLYHSHGGEQGVRYRILASYPLSPAP